MPVRSLLLKEGTVGIHAIPERQRRENIGTKKDGRVDHGNSVGFGGRWLRGQSKPSDRLSPDSPRCKGNVDVPYPGDPSAHKDIEGGPEHPRAFSSSEGTAVLDSRSEGCKPPVPKNVNIIAVSEESTPSRTRDQGLGYSLSISSSGSSSLDEDHSKSPI